MKQLNVYNLRIAVDGYLVDPQHEAKMVLEAVNEAIADLRGNPSIVSESDEIKADYEAIAGV